MHSMSFVVAVYEPQALFVALARSLQFEGTIFNRLL